MKPYKNFDRKNTINDNEKLPVGAYVCRIISAKEIETPYGRSLALAFDISEGEYAGFYDRKFKANTNEDKKWPGVYRLSIPAEDGTEADDWKIRNFNTAIVNIEEANPGYSWDWDERKLKDKIVGIVFNRKEFVTNDGRVIAYTQPKKIEAVSKVRDGSYYVPKDQLLSDEKKQPQQDTSWIDTQSDDDLPFA